MLHFVAQSNDAQSRAGVMVRQLGATRHDELCPHSACTHFPYWKLLVLGNSLSKAFYTCTEDVAQGRVGGCAQERGCGRSRVFDEAPHRHCSLLRQLANPNPDAFYPPCHSRGTYLPTGELLVVSYSLPKARAFPQHVASRYIWRGARICCIS